MRLSPEVRVEPYDLVTSDAVDAADEDDIIQRHLKSATILVTDGLGASPHASPELADPLRLRTQPQRTTAPG